MLTDVVHLSIPQVKFAGGHLLCEGRDGLRASSWHPAGSDIADLQSSDPSFSMAGASWTNNLSWVEGYANVLEPMQQLSARFHQRFDPLVAADPTITTTPAYQQALLHLLLSETSCFRYWGQGTWTDYAAEMYRRGMNLCCNGSTDGG